MDVDLYTVNFVVTNNADAQGLEARYAQRGCFIIPVYSDLLCDTLKMFGVGSNY